jgi:hypothetical protein
MEAHLICRCPQVLCNLSELDCRQTPFGEIPSIRSEILRRGEPPEQQLNRIEIISDKT